MKRRTFIKMSGGIAAGVCMGCLAGCDSDKDEPAPDAGVNQNAIEIKLGDYPELLNPGGWVRVEGSGKPALLVIHYEPLEYAVLSAICTHRGAKLDYDSDNKKVYCGAHHSEFDLDGNVIKGPADTALVKYQVEVQDDVLQVSSMSA